MSTRLLHSLVASRVRSRFPDRILGYAASQGTTMETPKSEDTSQMLRLASFTSCFLILFNRILSLFWKSIDENRTFVVSGRELGPDPIAQFAWLD